MNLYLKNCVCLYYLQYAYENTFVLFQHKELIYLSEKTIILDFGTQNPNIFLGFHSNLPFTYWIWYCYSIPLCSLLWRAWYILNGFCNHVAKRILQKQHHCIIDVVKTHTIIEFFKSPILKTVWKLTISFKK